MTPIAPLVPEGEAAWLRVKQHLQWCDSFALVFVFSDQPAVADCLRERLADVYRARITRLEVPMPRSPEALFEDLLPRLLHPPPYQLALNAPLWLDLARPPGGADTLAIEVWREARLQFLARLNEQREPLRRALSRPLILVLPLAEKARIKALAPDLWAIRHFSLELGPWLVPARAEPPTPSPPRPEPFPLGQTESSLVQEWHRVRHQSGAGHSAILAADRAYRALLSRGHLQEAREAAAWMLGTARTGLIRGQQTPEALRDLSVSLNNVGNTDRALGDLAQARAAFAEGLEIAKQLATVLPNHVDYKDLPAWFTRRLRNLDEGQGAAGGR